MGTDDTDVCSLFWTTLWYSDVMILYNQYVTKACKRLSAVQAWAHHSARKMSNYALSFQLPVPKHQLKHLETIQRLQEKSIHLWQEFQPKSIHPLSWQKRTAMALVYVHFDQVLRKSSVTPCRRVFEEHGKRQWNTAEPFGWAVHRLKSSGKWQK